MKNFLKYKTKHSRFAVGAMLIVFSFSLQSFNGYRIEKRHYRKGYYVHICHKPKTHPVYTGISKEASMTTMAAVEEKEEPLRAGNSPSAGNADEGRNAPRRNIAPVSMAPHPNN